VTGVLLSALSYVEKDRILQDVGLGALRFFGAAMSIFLGVGLIHREIERRTVYTLLSKPISRSQFLLGKYLGLVATVWIQIVAMAVAFAGVSLLAGAELGLAHGAAIGLAAMECALLVAVATLFSSFTTPLLASCYAVGIWMVGHLTRDLRALGEASESPAAETVTAFLHRVLPDLSGFNLSVQAVYGLPVGAADVVWPALYGVAYATALLLLAAFVFERRDLR